MRREEEKNERVYLRNKQKGKKCLDYCFFFSSLSLQRRKKQRCSNLLLPLIDECGCRFVVDVDEAVFAVGC